MAFHGSGRSKNVRGIGGYETCDTEGRRRLFSGGKKVQSNFWDLTEKILKFQRGNIGLDFCSSKFFQLLTYENTVDYSD